MVPVKKKVSYEGGLDFPGWLCVYQIVFRCSKQVPHENRFTKDIDFVARFPIDPDILDREPARVFDGMKSLHIGVERNRILLQRRLQSPGASATRVKMAGPRGERQDLRVGNSSRYEVAGIERQGQRRRHIE